MARLRTPEPHPGPRRIGVVLAVSTAVISGFSVFVNGYGVRAWRSTADPTTYTTFKNVVAAIALVGIAVLFTRRSGKRPITVPSSRRQWLGLSVVAIFGGAVAFALFFEGLARASSAQAAFIHKTLIIWVGILAVGFLKERLRPIHVFAVVLLIAGQLFLVGGLEEVTFGTGEIMILGATLLWSVEIVVAKRLLVRVSSSTVGIARMGGGALALVAWGIASGGFSSMGAVSVSQLGWVLVTGVMLSAYVATWYAALSRAPAIDVTAILAGGAVITALLRFVVDGTPFRSPVGLSLVAIGAAGVVLAGIGISRRDSTDLVARNMTNGAALFCRYAFPPNVLGYCGPPDAGLLTGAATTDAVRELREIAMQFDGAWPYLELIAGLAGRDPLDHDVVEAYWIGNHLTGSTDLLTWGNSINDRFRKRAGTGWDGLSGGIVEGQPNHAFHVFCVYPWVGMLRSGFADHALDVLDRCRIRWGTVLSVDGNSVVAKVRPLVWDGIDLARGSARAEVVTRSLDVPAPHVGDQIAMHWDYMCGTLRPNQLRNLKNQTAHHVAIANRSLRERAEVLPITATPT